MFDSLLPSGLLLTWLLCPWDSPGQNTGVGCHALLQGIFPTWGTNPHLLQLLTCRWILYCWGFPSGSEGEESACNVGDLGSIPDLVRSPGGGNGNLFQCSGLENCMDRGAWQATVHGVTKSRTWLSNFHSFTLEQMQQPGHVSKSWQLSQIGRDLPSYLNFPVAQTVKNLPVIQETWVRPLGHKDLEKDITSHSSIPAWRILWTEEPGGLQFMWSQRVGHNWVTDPTTALYLWATGEAQLSYNMC